jgi:O-antigen ligase
MLISLLGIVQYHLGGVPACLDFLYYRYIPMYGRAMSVFSNPNHLGGFLAPMVVIIVAFLFSESTKQWWRSSFLLCALILDSWALIISFSRGAMVQTFLAIVVMGVFYYAKVSEKMVSWKVGVLAILILTIVFIGIQYYSVYMRARLSMYDNWGDYQAALRWIETTNDFYRKTAAIKAFQTFLKHPLIGLGYGLFPGKGIAGFEFFGLAVHNQVLKILVEMGLLGFIPFVILLGSITKTGLTICKKNQEKPVGQEVKIIVGFLLSGMSAIVFGYLFSDTLSMLAITGYFWIFSGAIFVLERRYVQNIDKFPAIQQANEALDKL